MKDTRMQYSSKLDDTGNEQFIFGTLFMIANQLQTMMDRELQAFDMTSKQWFMTIIISTLFDSPPTLSEVAQAMGNTHQNVKQVALKLQKKGFLDICCDDQDARAVRLALTEKSRDFWAGLQQSSEHFLGEVFKGLSEEEKAAMRNTLAKVMFNTDVMSKKNFKRRI